MSVQSPDLCRITVVGPERKADLAVPLSSTVASLLPVLLMHTGSTELPLDAVPDQETDSGAIDNLHGSWVLQRLGGASLDPEGTPETLNWLDGERFYLRRADSPLPELDFDDIADGMATAVDRQRNHWRPEHARPVYLTLAAIPIVAIFLALFHSSSAIAATIGSSVLAVLCTVASVSMGRWSQDGVASGLAGLAACCFAAFAAAVGVMGPDHVLEPRSDSLVLAALCATGNAAVLLGARYSVADRVPIVPFGVAALLGATTMISVWLHDGVEYTMGQTAAIVCSAYFVVMIFAPKIAIRMARLRGPQLPRKSDELQVDIEPAPAAEVMARTTFADRYLAVIAISASLAIVVSFPYLLSFGGWVQVSLPVVFTAALLLRARNFIGLVQRLAVTTGGTACAVLLVLDQVDGATVGYQWVVIVVLLGLIPPLVMAANRPPTRRLLPIWGHLGNILDTLTALAMIPLMLHVLGIYAWARGLAG
jgi:type VII secretion integral membrane protein EccD